MLERGLSPVLSSHTCAMIFHSITIITMVRFDRFDQQLVVILKKMVIVFLIIMATTIQLYNLGLVVYSRHTITIHSVTINDQQENWKRFKIYCVNIGKKKN